MKIKQVRLERYKRRFSKEKVILVQHCNVMVEEWKKLREQCAALGSSVEVVKNGLLGVCFYQANLSGANAVITYVDSSLIELGKLIATQSKLYALGCRVQNGEVSKMASLHMQGPFVDMLNQLAIIEVLSHHYISMLKVLQYANNKSSGSQEV